MPDYTNTNCTYVKLHECQIIHMPNYIYANYTYADNTYANYMYAIYIYVNYIYVKLHIYGI